MESALSAEAKAQRGPRRGAFCLSMDGYDAMGAVGLVLVTAGCYLVWPPLALLVPGVALLVVAVVGAGRRGR